MKETELQDTEIIRISPVNKNDLKKGALTKIGGINALVSQMPNLIAANQLSDAYRVIISPGISGKLMQYKDGLLGTPMLKDGKISGHAGLESTSGMVSPMLVFTAMSIVTGQYFLSRINRSIENVLDEIRKIKDLFLLKEESNLFSYGIFLKRISEEYSYINSSPALKTATLCNIQNTVNELSASVYFYTHNSIAVIDGIRNTSFREEFDISGLRQNLEKLKASLDMRNMFIILEFAFSQSFDRATVQAVRDRILNSNKEIFDPFIEKILVAANSMKTALVSDANKLSKQQRLNHFMDELASLNTGINRQYMESTSSKVNEAFMRLEQIDRDGTEYYILDDGIYIES